MKNLTFWVKPLSLLLLCIAVSSYAATLPSFVSSDSMGVSMSSNNSSSAVRASAPTSLGASVNATPPSQAPTATFDDTDDFPYFEETVLSHANEGAQPSNRKLRWHVVRPHELYQIEILKRVIRNQEKLSDVCTEKLCKEASCRPGDSNCVSQCLADCQKLLDWEIANGEQFGHYCPFFVDPKTHKVGHLGRIVVDGILADIESKKIPKEKIDDYITDNRNPRAVQAVRNNVAAGAIYSSSVFLKDYEDLQAPNVCPGYQAMGAAMKTIFWSWFFENLAYRETSCRPHIRNNASDVPNGPALGLYQLEPFRNRQGRALRESRGGACMVTDRQIMDPVHNTQCTLHIFSNIRLVRDHQRVFGFNNPANQNKYVSSYWQALNTRRLGSNQKGKERDLNERFKWWVSQFPFCNAQN